MSKVDDLKTNRIKFLETLAASASINAATDRLNFDLNTDDKSDTSEKSAGSNHKRNIIYPNIE